jgi:hypothetical protein
MGSAIAQSVLLRCERARGSIPGRCRRSFCPHDRPPSLLYTGYHGVKRPEREARYSPPSNAEVENGGATPPLPIRFDGVVLNWLSNGATLAWNEGYYEDAARFQTNGSLLFAVRCEYTTNLSILLRIWEIRVHISTRRPAMLTWLLGLSWILPRNTSNYSPPTSA